MMKKKSDPTFQNFTAFLIICLLAGAARVQAQFVQKQDSVGLPSRQMDITTYLADGRMATQSRTYNDQGSMSGFVEDHRVYSYFPDGKLQYDEQYHRESSSSDTWVINSRYEYAYDGNGNTTAWELRAWDENAMEWEDELSFGEIMTFNEESLLLTLEYKENYGSNGYHTTALIEYTYNDEGRPLEKHITEYNSSGGIFKQMKEEYTYSDANSALVEKSRRFYNSGPYFPIEECAEIYDDNGNLVERITSEISDGQMILVERYTLFYSEQGFHGGYRREDYVNGSWQLDDDYIWTFDEFGNRISHIARSFNEDTQSPETRSTGTTEYDYNSPMETIMSPLSGFFPSLPPIHKPLTQELVYYQDGEISEIRDFIYYYSDVVLSTSAVVSSPRITLFPNPSSNMVRFDAEQATSPLSIKIFSSEGRMVKKDDIMSMEPLDISDLSPGLYQCLIQVENGYFTETLVVKGR
ncbi:MAG: T9SS type A sorting domain-containing protein [Cryomorphaceae bacterium]